VGAIGWFDDWSLKHFESTADRVTAYILFPNAPPRAYKAIWEKYYDTKVIHPVLPTEADVRAWLSAMGTEAAPPLAPPLWMLIPALTPVIFNLAVVLYSEGAKLALSS